MPKQALLVFIQQEVKSLRFHIVVCKLTIANPGLKAVASKVSPG
jgi:hypothetical protein